MVTKRAPKTREEKLAERRAEIDAIAQMEANRAVEQAERQQAHNEFAARVQAHHDAIDSFIHRRWAQLSDEPMTDREYYAMRGQIEQEAYAQAKAEGSIPSWNDIYDAKHAEEQAAREQAEAERIAAIPDEHIWFSVQSREKQKEISSWQKVNPLLKYPVPLAELEAVRASRPKPEPEPEQHAKVSTGRGREAVLQSILKTP